jgi:aerobic-type carbon monoxide dehydrogenase small subunit (CoxS/CutS family)
MTQDGTFTITVDGQPVSARQGHTVAAVLVASGRQVLRHTHRGTPRGVFCGMGVCFDCLVTIDDLPDQRACMTLKQPGMRLQLAVQGTSAGESD